jgi:ATP-dependent Clp protease ATP-binding subunit ClpB
VSLSDGAVEWLTKQGYDPQYGARPVKRLIQRNIMNELSKMIIAGKIDHEKKILIEVEEDRLAFSNH